MSGSSLGYLYQQTIGLDAVSSTHNLEQAIDHLELHHPGTRAAANARAILEGIRHLNKVHESLADVFKSIEWMLSGDGGTDDIDKAVEEYEQS
jgi:hypothetical protein